MIKLFEEFYSNDVLISKLHNEISRDEKEINDFSCYYDGKSGVIEWTSDSSKYSIYATPYWEENDELPIHVIDTDTEEYVINNKIIIIKKLETLEDVEFVKNFYYNFMRDFIDRLPELIAGQKYNL